MKQTRQPGRSVKQSIYLDVYDASMPGNLFINFSFVLKTYFQWKPVSKLLLQKFPEASLLNKRLTLSSSFRCGQIYKYEIYDFGHTLLCYLSWIIDIESLQNRLLKVCYVPATSASLPRVSFFFSLLFLLLQPLTVLMKQTRHP
jgi:hypothetical protein